MRVTSLCCVDHHTYSYSCCVDLFSVRMADQKIKSNIEDQLTRLLTQLQGEGEGDRV